MTATVEIGIEDLQRMWIADASSTAQGWTLLSDREGGDNLDSAIGLLCGLSPRVQRLAFVLRSGRNEIGRGCGAMRAHLHELAGIVEGYQWTIECRLDGVFVSDERSSNGSVLLHGAERSQCDLRLDKVWQAGVGVRLGWDGQQQYLTPALMKSGDVLVGYYEPFAYIELAGGLGGLSTR